MSDSITNDLYNFDMKKQEVEDFKKKYITLKGLELQLSMKS